MSEVPAHTREPLEEGGFIARFEDGVVLTFESWDERLLADATTVDAMLRDAYLEARAGVASRALLADRDRMRRLFNRLEAAVTLHKNAHDDMGLFVEADDAALWKVRDKILKDYAEGNG